MTDSQILKTEDSEVLIGNEKVIKISYIVDQQFGPYKTIQEAIKDAKPDSVIKVNSGLYKENLVVKKPGLKILTKDFTSEVYIMGNKKKPTVHIDLPNPEDTCTLQGLRLAHKGHVLSNHQVHQPGHFIEKKLVLGRGVETISTCTYQFSRCQFSADQECLVLLSSGILQLRNCMLNLNLLTCQNQPYIASVLLCRNTSAIITNCDFRGSKNFSTSGIMVNEAKLVIKECSINNFSAGGIYVFLVDEKKDFNVSDFEMLLKKRKQENQPKVPENTVKILNCSFSENKYVGIQVLGNTDQPIIENCRITHNDCPGIQICPGSKCQLRKNNIVVNTDGVEVISADPVIRENNISKNYKNGILVRSVGQYICQPVIKLNNIQSNKQNGILCEGIFTIPRIINNPNICLNKMAGIMVVRSSQPIILDNKIFKNLFQGILLVDNTSAHIENNEIYDNIKANIAFGGAESRNTVIIRNDIHGGRCEGIFMIEGGRALIRHNKIRNNYDGIILITSIPSIHYNVIEGNKNHGMMVLKDSRPKFFSNEVRKNNSVGLFIRDKSKGEYYKNKFDENKLGIVIERKNEIFDKIMEENKVNDPTRLPFKSCNLI